MSTPATAPRYRLSVFISYSITDSEWASELRKQAEANGAECFAAEKDIPVQSDWEVQVIKKVRSCQLFLLLFSAASRDSNEVRKELQLALSEHKEIWVAELEPTKLNGFFKGEPFMEKNITRLWGDGKSVSFMRLLNKINEQWPIIPFTGRVAFNNCPYPGPAPFSKEFADVFFGRVETINELKSAVNGDKRVLLVWGASGAGKTSLLTVGLGKALAPHYFYSQPVDGESAGILLRRLYTRVSGGLRLSESDEEDIGTRIVAAIEKRPESDLLFCFDQMENFFTWPVPSGKELNLFLRALETIIEKKAKRVTIIISFRKESLADVQPHVQHRFKGNWGEFIVRKLTGEGALICITEPARLRNVEFDEQLARAIIAPIEQDLGGVPVVDPMNIQKVCQALWRDVAKTQTERLWRIDGSVLPGILHKDEGLKRNAAEYVSSVLREYLRERIKEIANGLPPATAGPTPEDYVLLSLLEFVGPDNTRQRVREATTKEGPKVGRLSIAVVNQLVGSGLVRRCGDKEYELAHDALADEIGKHGETSAAVAAMRTLDSLLTWENGCVQTAPGFYRDSDLLARLEAVRENHWPFQEEEAELIFRRALGERRRSVRAGTISVDAWARVLAQKAPERLIQTLSEGLADKQRSVQLDVLDQLLKPEIRVLVRDIEAKSLSEKLSTIALDGESSDEVREKATKALVGLGYENTIGGLFESYANPATRRSARTALALVRHAEERSDALTPSFRIRWRLVSPFGRLRILVALWWWRLQQNYRWILYLIAVGTPITALGAALPFILLGHFGASLTMNTDFSSPVGMFHGVSGGLVWGSGVTTGLLIYAVIIRGGRIRDTFADSIGLAFWAALGGALAGVLNTCLIALVFARVGLYRGGWFLTADPNAPKLYQVFGGTRYGWITPIFGAALGIGVGFSLKGILAKPLEHWIDECPNPLGKDKLTNSIRKITLIILLRSWINVICIGIAAVAVLLVARPGPGTCDPSINSLLPVVCAGQPLLPPQWLRTAGLAVVFFTGSLGQEISFLWGLLRIQFSIPLNQNRDFIRPADSG